MMTLQNRLQLVQTLLATACLLYGVAAHATKLSPLPLKASVLAKPNVVFAMDDSGSMDAEMMLDGTFQGYFYGNYRNDPLLVNGRPRSGQNSFDWNYFYLFPNGTGAGNRVYGDSFDEYGIAAPPIPELAFLRSSAYNPIYYDTNRSYEPWSPAFVDGETRSYGAASTTAARSHPALGSTTIALGETLDATDTQWRFTFAGGMRIPANATHVRCLNGTSPTIPAEGLVVTNARGMCKAAMPYYPATFWHPETCVVDNTSCVTAYDGRTLKRHEIRAGNSFPSGRSHAAELQNFANWFTYYRKRRLMLAGAMGEVLENMGGLRLGVVNFNPPRNAPSMVDADTGTGAGSRMAVAGRFYTAEGGGGTPTHATMAHVYSAFDTDTSIIQYACQRNVSFIITDGFANDAALAPPAYNQATWGAAPPYQSIFAGSLADKALAHYTLRLRASGATALASSRVPRAQTDSANPDNNTDLHLQTYALTLGMKGTVWPTAVDPFTTAPTWPTPTPNSPAMIDDLWHATINGRGKMYLATDAGGTSDGIRAGLLDILNQTGAQSGVAVSSINLERGDTYAYLATYNPSGWTGDLKARTIDASTGAVSETMAWSASDRLTARDWSTRVIATHTGSAGVGISAAQVPAIANPGGAWGSDTAVINYLRGNRAGEGTSFRARTGLIGAVINAEPVASRDDRLVYLASGEGMLHAIDSQTGDEHWAFIPGRALADMGRISSRTYAFSSRLDAAPALGKLAGSGKRLLVGGLGGAGRGYYALDVTTPRNMTETALASAAIWQFPAASDSTNFGRMGFSNARPVIAKTASQGDVVLVTSGYDNGLSIGDGKGRMWMLNALTGAVLREFVTSEGTAGGAEAGLAHVSGFRETDGTVRHVYGGDLLGNLWHFDLNTGTTTRLAVLQDADGQAQPVTAAPELVQIGGKRVVLVGTGRLLDASDFGSTRTQSFYVIADGSSLANARAGLKQRIYSRGANPELSGVAMDWSTDRGWYFDLPAGEQANTLPTVAYGTVGFVTNRAGANDCTAGSHMYLVDIGSGLKSDMSDIASSLVSDVANASRLTTLRLVGGRLVGVTQTSSGTVFRREMGALTPIQPTKNVWRELRR